MTRVHPGQPLDDAAHVSDILAARWVPFDFIDPRGALFFAYGPGVAAIGHVALAPGTWGYAQEALASHEHKIRQHTLSLYRQLTL